MEGGRIELRKRKPERRAGDKARIKSHPVLYIRQRREGSRLTLVKLGELVGGGVNVESNVREDLLGRNTLQDPVHLALIVATDEDVVRVRAAINRNAPVTLIGEPSLTRGASFDTDFECVGKSVREGN